MHVTNIGLQQCVRVFFPTARSFFFFFTQTEICTKSTYHSELAICNYELSPEAAMHSILSFAVTVRHFYWQNNHLDTKEQRNFGCESALPEEKSIIMSSFLVSLFAAAGRPEVQAWHCYAVIFCGESCLCERPSARFWTSAKSRTWENTWNKATNETL